MKTAPSAAPNGQSRACMNWFWITLPISGTRAPPMRSVMANMPTAGTNTSSVPAAMPGSVSGMMTAENTRRGPAPRSWAASIRLPSSFSTLP